MGATRRELTTKGGVLIYHYGHGTTNPVANILREQEDGCGLFLTTVATANPVASFGVQ